VTAPLADCSDDSSGGSHNPCSNGFRRASHRTAAGSAPLQMLHTGDVCGVVVLSVGGVRDVECADESFGAVGSAR
jgi:hypothetical protein